MPAEPPAAGAPLELVAPFRLEYTYRRSLGPVLSELATALRDGRLLGARTAAGRVIVPPAEYDPDTGEATTGLVEVGPEGTITTWTWVAAPRDRHPLPEPFAWALVLLDGADTALLHAVRAPGPWALRTGARVRVQWNPTRVGAITDCHFALVAEADRAPPRPVGGAPVTRLTAPTRLDYLVHAGRVTGDFLRAILERRLVGRRCPSCARTFLPPRGSCPTCGVPTTEQVELGQTGTVTTFSVVRIPFEGQLLTPPYACAHILVDGADTPLLHLVGECDVDEVRIGMRVRAVWSEEPAPTLASVRYFRPTHEPDAPVAELA